MPEDGPGDITPEKVARIIGLDQTLPSRGLLPPHRGTDPLAVIWGSLPDGLDRKLVAMLRQDPIAMAQIERDARTPSP